MVAMHTKFSIKIAQISSFLAISDHLEVLSNVTLRSLSRIHTRERSLAAYKATSDTRRVPVVHACTCQNKRFLKLQYVLLVARDLD